MKKTIILGLLLAFLFDLTLAIRCYECAGLKCNDPFNSDLSSTTRCSFEGALCYVTILIPLKTHLFLHIIFYRK